MFICARLTYFKLSTYILEMYFQQQMCEHSWKMVWECHQSCSVPQRAVLPPLACLCIAYSVSVGRKYHFFKLSHCRCFYFVEGSETTIIAFPLLIVMKKDTDYWSLMGNCSILKCFSLFLYVWYYCNTQMF